MSGVAPPRKTVRLAANSRLNSHVGFRRTPVLVLMVGLALVGFVAVLSTFASSGKYRTILAIGDVDNGFANALIAINPENGNLLKAVPLPNLENLPGCVATQPKPYLYDMVVDQDRKVVFASLKACRGGTLSSSRAIARFSLATGKFDGYLEGLPDGSSLMLHAQSGSVMALSASGTQLWLYDITSNRVRHKLNFTGKEVSRFGTFSGNTSAALVFTDGVIQQLDVISGAQKELLRSNISFPKAVGSDGRRALFVSDALWAFGSANGTSQLVGVTSAGTVKSYPLGSIGTSLDYTPDNSGLILATGCPTGLACVAAPNRIYLFDTAKGEFRRNSQYDYLPIQTSPGRVRLDASQGQLLFDGVVAGASGSSQRFLFSVDLEATQPTTARIPLTSPVWESVMLDAALLNTNSNTPAQEVPAGVPSGGGIGPGGIAQSPTPMDEIERILGVSIYDIDWNLISDDQIRAFGYDPASVRREIARLKQLRGDVGGVGNSEVISCRLGDAQQAAQVAAIEKLIGVPLATFDFSQVTDAQIQQFGYEPTSTRRAVADYQASVKATANNDPCANTFTKNEFVVEQGSNQAGTASGTVTQVTATTRFDLLSGGWYLDIRWQAPGGAAKFHIYGRDIHGHQQERRLATVSGLDRSVRFGGFGRAAFPPWHSEQYTVAIVPEQVDGTTAVPTAIKTDIRCYVVWCSASAQK